MLLIEFRCEVKVGPQPRAKLLIGEAHKARWGRMEKKYSLPQEKYPNR